MIGLKVLRGGDDDGISGDAICGDESIGTRGGEDTFFFCLCLFFLEEKELRSGGRDGIPDDAIRSDECIGTIGGDTTIYISKRSEDQRNLVSPQSPLLCASWSFFRGGPDCFE